MVKFYWRHRYPDRKSSASFERWQLPLNWMYKQKNLPPYICRTNVWGNEDKEHSFLCQSFPCCCFVCQNVFWLGNTFHAIKWLRGSDYRPQHKKKKWVSDPKTFPFAEAITCSLSFLLPFETLRVFCATDRDRNWSRTTMLVQSCFTQGSTLCHGHTSGESAFA